MLRKLRERINSEEKGFTLIELLVVILIIGILAAIALPAFLGQQEKGQDADAKSTARNLASQLESCYANEQTYANCAPNGNQIQNVDTGLDLSGTVVNGLGATSYTITTTVPNSNPARTFTITKANGGPAVRSCNTPGRGGCRTGNVW